MRRIAPFWLIDSTDGVYFLTSFFSFTGAFQILTTVTGLPMRLSLLMQRDLLIKTMVHACRYRCGDSYVDSYVDSYFDSFGDHYGGH